ncbi:hypothetical protein Pmar_PMAR002310 [Perkinsus marinus ATCC 50983]|uniref:Uncharacterized protein n=1 Tax=Perkinsus marinus (strain ATCC 50983 / TXsc) TaxID=423536 RepID=C5KUZ2_PERM5|nr:hypothetical protein Pmar_PMAR002310 [Perkinsus marinus ATCC 50983]EER11707.1 hypothetical protein Pmar_PMAR002310 [Perkinsus marinus ATCC 50983]|eukprot:XP_002779912.1 hypothetical protein Pmar_PMAR002310 [Perkinsus marinus ATCC 50983]
MDKVDAEQQGCASASVKGKVTEGESDGKRRDRFGCVIMSKSKSHSLCFADEVPGANRGPLVFTVNVESFKDHNRVSNYTYSKDSQRVNGNVEPSNVPVCSRTSLTDSESKPLNIKFYICS